MRRSLTYWLSGAAAGTFSIDAATGQLMTDNDLDYEDTTNYEVTVNAADSSGTGDGTDMITVTIMVLNVDEKPTVAGPDTAEFAGVSVIERVEGETALDADPNTGDVQAATYTASDQEGVTVTFSLGGADKDMFKLNDLESPDATMRVLAFKEKPDFEMPMDSNKDNVYEVMVQASDGLNTGMKSVIVKVTNMEEDGEVKVTPEQPRVGVEMTAGLTDSDGVAYGPMWQWERTENCESPEWMSISSAKSATYTPSLGDLDDCLRVTAMYNDGFYDTDTDDSGSDTETMFDKTAEMVLSAVQLPTENMAPKFASAMTMRFVRENEDAGASIGKPVTATDPNGANDSLEYSLGGSDAGSFNIDVTTGQLTTGMKFNHEKKGKYAVTVTATDTAGATASIRVDIYVNDVDEAPSILEGGLSISGDTEVSLAEGSMTTVESYTAAGPNAATARWTLEGADMGDFMVQPSSGMSVMLKFRSSPNYESPADDGADNVYMVTVKASDGTNMAMTSVTVTVTNVEEDGTVMLSSMTPVVGVELTATLSDPDGSVTGTTWQWSKSMTMDGTFEDIDGATMMNYMPVAADEGYYLRATATYTDGYDSGNEEMATTTGMVTTVQDQMGTVRLSPMDPVVGVALTATLTDGNDGVTGATWQWSKSMTMDGTFMNITTGATSRSYTPVDGDVGYYLQVKVMYTDAQGPNKSAMATTTNKVVADADALLVARYDTNGTPGIQKDEVIAAINHYLFGEGAAAISKADVIKLINLYLFG